MVKLRIFHFIRYTNSLKIGVASLICEVKKNIRNARIYTLSLQIMQKTGPQSPSFRRGQIICDYALCRSLDHMTDRDQRLFVPKEQKLHPFKYVLLEES